MATQDTDWEKVEEPALRPYKGFFRGVGALAHHTVKAFADGNEKFPVLGSVEVIHGIRRGGVELATRTFEGMVGLKSKPYDKVSKPNQIIEGDLFLRNAADMTTAALLFAPGAGSAATVTTVVGLHGAQYAVDRSPLDPNKAERKLSRVEKAQERSLGKRHSQHPKRPTHENLLQLAK